MVRETCNEKDNKTASWHLETTAVHAGMQPDPATGAIMTPIYQTSTFVQSSLDEHQRYEYARTDNPTRSTLQEALATLEGGRFALAFASGLAAVDTLLRLVKPSEHVVASDNLYGGTYRLFEHVLSEHGLQFTFVNAADLEVVKSAMRNNTRLVWLETPTNPLLKLADIEAIAKIASRASAWLAVDNTFASPILQQPLQLGADFVIHSTTKYIGGHSDAVGGAIVLNDPALYERLKYLQNAIGAIPGPMDCFLLLRGMRTLALRMAKHSQNGLELARFLADHSAVAEVVYPGLEDHPQHALAKKQMRASGGMLSFVLHGGEKSARYLVTRTKLFKLAVSLGGVESLIELPGMMTHASMADSPLAIDRGLVRVSAGIENAADLIADLRQALEATDS